MSDQDINRLIGAIERLTFSTDSLRQAFRDSQPGSESAAASSVPALESSASGSLVRDNTLVIQRGIEPPALSCSVFGFLRVQPIPWPRRRT